MAFIRHAGRTKLINVPVTTSQVFTAGAVCAYSSNLAAPATSSSAVAALIGVIRKAIAATDSDYATARSVLIEVPLDKMVEWEALTTGSTYAVGEECDLSDSVTLNRGAQSIKVALIRQVVDSTHAIVCLKFGGAY